MFAKINHMAMISPIYPMLANFYEAYFGLKRSGKTSRPLNAVTVGDGYVGLNINPLRDGYVGGLDHFGVVVDDIDTVLDARARKIPAGEYRQAALDPAVRELQRPRSRRQRVRPRPEGRGRQAGRRLCRAGGGRLEPGPLSRQVRDPHHEPGEVRRLLSICVRAQAGEPQRRRAATISPTGA